MYTFASTQFWTEVVLAAHAVIMAIARAIAMCNRTHDTRYTTRHLGGDSCSSSTALCIAKYTRALSSTNPSPVACLIVFASLLALLAVVFLKDEASLLVQTLSMFGDHESYMRGREEWHRESENIVQLGSHRTSVKSSHSSRSYAVLGL